MDGNGESSLLMGRYGIIMEVNCRISIARLNNWRDLEGMIYIYTQYTCCPAGQLIIVHLANKLSFGILGSKIVPERMFTSMLVCCLQFTSMNGI